MALNMLEVQKDLVSFKREGDKWMNQIHTDLVKRLIGEQFPEWAHLEAKPVKFSGHKDGHFGKR